MIDDDYLIMIDD